MIAVVVAIIVSGAYLASLDTGNANDTQIMSNAIVDKSSTASLLASETESTRNSSSDEYRYFAIFTLPYEENDASDGQGANAFTVEDYEEAMRIMEVHIDSRPSHEYDGVTDQDRFLHDYIIQSIRVIIEKRGSHETGQAEALQPADARVTQVKKPFEILDGSHKMITVQSLDNITDAVQFSRQFHNVTHILYDIEHWSRTPESEQENPIESISKAGQSIHAASLKYGITPDATFLIDNYRYINWDEIDFLGMQLQRYSQDIVEFSNYTEDISKYVKAQNPSVQIFVQLSFRFTDAKEMIDAIEVARPWVDGYIIAYLPSTSDCLPQCSPDALDLVLRGVRGDEMDTN
jgi:hypothetical protein